MGQGAQSRALRIANQTQYGFDATKIYKDATLSEVDSDISNFDAVNGIKNRAGTGKLPEDIPAEQKQFAEAEGPRFQESVTFNSPDASRENKDRATSDSDPFAGMGGM